LSAIIRVLADGEHMNELADQQAHGPTERSECALLYCKYARQVRTLCNWRVCCRTK
jgi:hypothetical protein